MSGKKYDLGKSMMGLLPFEALRAVGDVLTYGAQKYAAHNWRKGMKWSRVQDAMLRHYERFSLGEERDPDTGMLHTAHLACNALFLLAYQLQGLGEDDRWVDGQDYNPEDLERAADKSFADLDPEGTGTA
jgi:hypothetical protein